MGGSSSTTRMPCDLGPIVGDASPVVGGSFYRGVLLEARSDIPRADPP